MSLITQIKEKNLSARIQKLAFISNLLTTLIGEAEMIGKNDGNRAPTDAEVLALIRKFVKNNVETITALNSDLDDYRVLLLVQENKLLEKYLPKQLDSDELVSAVRSIIGELRATSSPANMGAVMKILKERFEGQYDGKAASMIIKVELA